MISVLSGRRMLGTASCDDTLRDLIATCCVDESPRFSLNIRHALWLRPFVKNNAKVIWLQYDCVPLVGRGGGEGGLCQSYLALLWLEIASLGEKKSLDQNYLSSL